MLDWEAVYHQALPYQTFLEEHGTEAHRQRWRAVYEQVTLTPHQQALLAGFQREMKVLVLAATWCGDCTRQCPVLRRFEEATPRIQLRFLERDTNPAVRDALALNGGHRVPVVVFLSEDYYECARYGDRVLSLYREAARHELGPACPTGIAPPPADLLGQVSANWLAEFERVQLMLRLSPRLRERHGD